MFWVYYVWFARLEFGRYCKLIERIQRQFTNKVVGLRQQSYVERLRRLGALFLEQMRLYADMVIVYKGE